MKTLPILLLAGLAGCSSLGTLDAAGAAQNLKNVEHITAQNEELLAASDVADSLKAVYRSRNEAAVRLAKSMADAHKEN